MQITCIYLKCSAYMHMPIYVPLQKIKSEQFQKKTKNHEVYMYLHGN